MDDPRRFPQSSRPTSHGPLFELAEASLAATTGQRADVCNAELGAALDGFLGQREGGVALAALFAEAPSAAVYRHLWRLLAQRERSGAPDPAQPVRLFVVPVVIVAAAETPEAVGTVIPCVLADAPAVAGLMREHGALAGNQSFALADTLVASDAIALERVPELLAWRTLAQGPGRARALPPASIAVGESENVHLRFVVGTALAAPEVDLFREGAAAKGGVALAQALSRALAVPGASVLALPRPPLPLVEGAWRGVLAQREVAAGLFASNALRRMRAATGEPAAVISVHESELAGQGAEVRLSLSSAFDPRAAEGFRCILHPLDRVDDVVAMLAAVLADCRVSDVRRMPGVHPDRDPATGLPLLFKAEAAPAAVPLH